jgi:hypothetical protein
MAFNTKLELYDGKFYQATGDTLSLCGSNAIGCAHYLTDKSAYFNACSLAIPDVAWVTGKTSCADCAIAIAPEAITGVTNGLTKNACHCAKLGGALCENTTIGNDTCTLSIKVATLDLTGSTAFNLSTGCALITDSNNHGLQYTCDYCATFCDESLITKRYVCSQTSGITTTYLCCANNGLTKKGQDVILGGALTGTTTLTCVGTDESQSFMVGQGSSALNQAEGGKLYIGRSCVTANHACNMVVANAISCVGCSSVIVCADAGINSMSCYGGLNRTTTLGTNALLYGGDYSSCFIARSIPDAAWVTGKTKNITNVGSQGQVIYRDATKLTGCTNMIYCDAKKSFAFGLNNDAGGNNSGAFGGEVNTACGADAGVFAGETNSVSGACSVILGGNDNKICSGALRSAIIGSQNITLTGATYNDTVAVDCLAIMNAIGCTCNLLCVNTTTGKVEYTSLSEFGGITGGTNGLSDCGSQRIGLGGALCANTSICGVGTEDLCLGTSASKLDYLFVYAKSCVCEVAGNIGIQSSGATYTDLNVSSFCPRGIRYATDYSLKYDARTLVDKGYVDSVATGLNIHAAVTVATTSPIVLSGSPKTIDGIPTTVGMRVLVKNQVSGATNGIYSASTGVWGRTSDYQTNVQITNGDLIPVLSGSSQNSSIWALITPEPITVGVTSLDYTEFSTVVDVQQGPGIKITQVGGVHTVCVNPTSPNSGLNLGGNTLAVGANHGLSISGTCLNANACSCGSVPAISVGYDTSNNLVVACDDIVDIMIATCALTGATNGLSASNGVVKLGGALCCTTKICGTNSFGLAITGLTTFNLGFGAGDVAGIVKDSASPTRGLQYAGDYSAGFCDNSLITKKYVCSQTSGVTGCAILCANNGLTKLGQNVVLGGALTGNTTICIGTHCLYFDSASVGAQICTNLNNGAGDATQICQTTKEIILCAYDTTDGGAYGSISVGGPTGATIYTNKCLHIDVFTNGCYDFTCDRLKITNSIGEYVGDYSTCYDCLSIPNVGWVTGKTSQADCAIAIAPVAITGVTNGLTKYACHDVCLGGTLTVANTNINGNSACCLSLTCLKEFHLGFCCGVVTDTCGTKKGLQYASDYSASFADNSLITKKYVCSQTSGITTGYLCGACNGLTKKGQVVVLGGALTGNTYITGAYLFGVDVTDINLTGSSAVSIGGAVKLTTTPTGGDCATDLVLVWNSGDKCVKALCASALGDKNNIYSKEVISVTAATLTTGSSFVILISPSATTTITLPSTPKDGEAFKLKDISGNALTLNIVVDAGAGKQIDNNQCALINTDYGALEIMYESAAGKWYSLAFIN